MILNLTYRTRQRLKKFGTVAGIALAVGILVWAVWLVWMGRYVVYSDGRASFVFDWQTPGELVEAVEPTYETVSVVMKEKEDLPEESSTELKQVSGYYVTASMLRNDLETVSATIRELPKDSVIMLDLKSIYGYYYYSTVLSGAKTVSNADIEAIDELIEYITQADFYTVARMPALRDRQYGLDHTQSGLHHTSGLYLWYDSDNCYWLDPTKSGTRSYLCDIALELKGMGFDEVVFTEFRFPDTENILFEGSKVDALNETALYLVQNCATADFAVSFECAEEGFSLPVGRSRLYRTDVAAADVASVAAAFGREDSEIYLVFVTEAMDTRFDAYGVLRPVDTGLDLTGTTDTPEESTPAETTAPTETTTAEE